MRLSIGPIPYFWEREHVLGFYEQVADSPAEIVCLGEVICSKRRLVSHEDWLAIGKELSQSGKEVILSSLTLLEAASEVGALKKLNCFPRRERGLFQAPPSTFTITAACGCWLEKG
jgi:hypothetical protein